MTEQPKIEPGTIWKRKDGPFQERRLIITKVDRFGVYYNEKAKPFGAESSMYAPDFLKLFEQVDEKA